MKVRALARYVPNVGRKGETRNIDGPSARVLILLGKVERVEDAPKPKAKAKAKARTYKRRDMVAEPVHVEPITEDVEPLAPSEDPE